MSAGRVSSCVNSSSPPNSTSSCQLVEFVANFRWVLYYASKRLQPFADRRYPVLLQQADDLLESLQHALSEEEHHRDVEGRDTKPLKSVRRVDEDAERIASLLRMASDGYLYLLVAEELLGTAPPTLHSFLFRAVSDSEAVRRHSEGSEWERRVTGGNSQSFVLLLRWMVHENILTEWDVQQMDLTSWPSSSVGTNVATSSRVSASRPPLGMEDYQRVAEQLAGTSAECTGIPFHLWGHLLVSQQLVLQEACRVLTIEMVERHVAHLQRSCVDPFRLESWSGSESPRRSSSAESESMESALLRWVRAVGDRALAFQTAKEDGAREKTRGEETIRSPYCRLLATCATELQRAIDLYEAIQSGLALAVVLHFYLPEWVKDPYRASSTSGWWAHVLHCAEEYLDVHAPFSASEALEYADSALSLHMFLLVQQLFKVLESKSEKDYRMLLVKGARDDGAAHSSGGLLRFRFLHDSPPSHAQRTRSVSGRAGPFGTAFTPSPSRKKSATRVGLSEKTIESISARVKEQQAPATLSEMSSPEPPQSPETRQTSRSLSSAPTPATPLKPMVRRPRSRPSASASRRETPPSLPVHESVHPKEEDRPPLSMSAREGTPSPSRRTASSQRWSGRVDHTTAAPFGTVSFILRPSVSTQRDDDTDDVTKSTDNGMEDKLRSAAVLASQHRHPQRTGKELIVVSARRKNATPTANTIPKVVSPRPLTAPAEGAGEEKKGTQTVFEPFRFDLASSQEPLLPTSTRSFNASTTPVMEQDHCPSKREKGTSEIAFTFEEDGQDDRSNSSSLSSVSRFGQNGLPKERSTVLAYYSANTLAVTDHTEGHPTAAPLSTYDLPQTTVSFTHSGSPSSLNAAQSTKPAASHGPLLKGRWWSEEAEPHENGSEDRSDDAMWASSCALLQDSMHTPCILLGGRSNPSSVELMLNKDPVAEAATAFTKSWYSSAFDHTRPPKPSAADPVHTSERGKTTSSSSTSSRSPVHERAGEEPVKPVHEPPSPVHEGRAVSVEADLERAMLLDLIRQQQQRMESLEHQIATLGASGKAVVSKSPFRGKGKPMRSPVGLPLSPQRRRADSDPPTALSAETLGNTLLSEPASAGELRWQLFPRAANVEWDSTRRIKRTASYSSHRHRRRKKSSSVSSSLRRKPAQTPVQYTASVIDAMYERLPRRRVRRPHRHRRHRGSVHSSASDLDMIEVSPSHSRLTVAGVPLLHLTQEVPLPQRSLSVPSSNDSAPPINSGPSSRTPPQVKHPLQQRRPHTSVHSVSSEVLSDVTAMLKGITVVHPELQPTSSMKNTRRQRKTSNSLADVDEQAASDVTHDWNAPVSYTSSRDAHVTQSV